MGFIKQKANQGDIKAQLLIGAVFAIGPYGIKQNIFEAKNHTKVRKWYRKATDQRDGTSLNNLGVFYVFSQGVPKILQKLKNISNRPACTETAKDVKIISIRTINKS
ncbi:SEL1-like repeat protein [Commensalibacter oyaizuii]|uniref:Uncharacterized protein n=1 Tax=Commensalibacter oyaizuii TaxID=3043873 RepID=A0ABT6Q1A5_9PROT|nr:hypothetical protein [Commensalibacter sp. TBRC 16381]MDI2090878.1 hypothetical protein [Commensalibacter sp. TBRC 16381]